MDQKEQCRLIKEISPKSFPVSKVWGKLFRQLAGDKLVSLCHAPVGENYWISVVLPKLIVRCLIYFVSGIAKSLKGFNMNSKHKCITKPNPNRVEHIPVPSLESHFSLLVGYLLLRRRKAPRLAVASVPLCNKFPSG